MDDMLVVSMGRSQGCCFTLYSKQNNPLLPAKTYLATMLLKLRLREVGLDYKFFSLQRK